MDAAEGVSYWAPCGVCGHQALEHGPDGCMRGWSASVLVREPCTCERPFVGAGTARDLSAPGVPAGGAREMR